MGAGCEGRITQAPYEKHCFHYATEIIAPTIFKYEQKGWQKYAQYINLRKLNKCKS